MNEKFFKYVLFFFIIFGLNLNNISRADAKKTRTIIGATVLSISGLLTVIAFIKYIITKNKTNEAIQINTQEELDDVIHEFSKQKEDTLTSYKQPAKTESSKEVAQEPLLTLLTPDRFKELFYSYNEAVSKGNTNALKNLVNSLEDYLSEKGFDLEATDILTAIKPFVQKDNPKFTNSVIETLKKELPQRAEQVRYKIDPNMNEARLLSINNPLNEGRLNEPVSSQYGNVEPETNFSKPGELFKPDFLAPKIDTTLTTPHFEPTFHEPIEPY